MVIGPRWVALTVWSLAAACSPPRTPGSQSAPAGIALPAASFSLDTGAFLGQEWALWRAGALIDTLVLPAEIRAVSVEARGAACEGTWPLMECTWNGLRVGRVKVASSEWRWYRMERRLAPGAGVLKIALLNDRFSSRGDLNLYVRAVVLSGETL